MDKNLVLSLVRSHLLSDPEFCSWVPAYTTVRNVKKRPVTVVVGGHYRRKAMYARAISALACTCKLHPLGPVALVPPPERVVRRRALQGPSYELDGNAP